ncbi:MAG: metallophosphoesterase, partial [Thermoplasmata archaeon]|nr:metallophosphoesterase [Thermoplasmata archaeon]
EWGENVIKILDSEDPDIVVITGDFTTESFIHEWDIAKEYVERIDAKTLIMVPGNHDARNEGYKIFEEIFETRFPCYEDEKVVILGLDSTVPDLDDGHIGRENYAIIEEKFSTKDKMKILALHHHLIAIPGTGRERNIAVDAGHVLRLITQLDVDFVLSGHKHLPWVWKLENTYFITAGTASSRRLKRRSHPSFNIMNIGDDGVVVEEINVSDKSREEILRAGLSD